MSEIRVTDIKGENGLDAVTLSKGASSVGIITATGLKVGTAISATDGAVSATRFHGSGASLTGIVSGLFSSYAIISHEKSNNTHGTSLSTSGYSTRELNTEIADPDGIVTISGNQFILQAGSYLIDSMSVVHRGNQSQSRLTNETDGTVVQYGMSVHSSDGNSGNVLSPVVARVTIGSAKAFEISTRVTNSDGENSGLANNFGNTQIYTIIKIFKES